MKVVIIGGSGNISRSIVRLLLEQGHDVTCFNRGKSGPQPEGARALHGDRSDRPSFEKLMQQERFEAAIDMICYNREDAASSLRAFRDVQQFIFTSTVCVYGINYDWLPASEDHPLRPITDYGRNKGAAEATFLEARYQAGFPVTIIRPSTTFGPKQGLIRQIAWDYSWLDRIRKGKPIVVCGDGFALHQFLHVDDAALGYAGVLGKSHCIGQVYNLVRRGHTTWADYHRTAMQVLGQEVELVGVPLANIRAADVPRSAICEEIFAHNVIYSPEKLYRDVPEFQPRLSLAESMRSVIEVLDSEGRIPDSDTLGWEDQLITAQRKVGTIRE